LTYSAAVAAVVFVIFSILFCFMQAEYQCLTCQHLTLSCNVGWLYFIA